ncbi:MAG: hypothetical protein L6R42_000083 [Xanthoria sp. 1 TBL-2021]|nr:MAG: hypothetical protein L6R42_000083 [Xanthoria sp. 1 TBL-2021]
MLAHFICPNPARLPEHHIHSLPTPSICSAYGLAQDEGTSSAPLWQLQFFRERGLKAILMGNVPPARTPSKQSRDETCWQKYTLWLQQYRDVIVGGLYGHMNIDHFMIQDTDQIDIGLITGKVEPAKNSRKPKDFSTQTSAEYLTEPRYGWSSLPDSFKFKNIDASKKKKKDRNKKKMGRKSKHEKFLDIIRGPWAERYSGTLVGAGVVPNYFPTMRVFDYNITGALKPFTDMQNLFEEEEEGNSQLEESRRTETSIGSKKHKFVKPHPPSKLQPPDPAYSPQTFSLASYSQYFANLTRNIGDFASPRRSKNARFTYEVEYDTKNDTVFGLENLTVRNYLDLAARIGDYKPRKDVLWSTTTDDAEDDMSMAMKKNRKHKKHKKQKRIDKNWFAFVNRAYVGTNDHDDLHDQFESAAED